MCKHILFNNFNHATDLETLSSFAVKTHDKDGFGAIMRLESGEIKTLKSLNQTDFYIRLMRELYKNKVLDLVVHHRTSTNKDGLDYAHPFEFQGQYLTHNGVVTVPGKHETKTLNDSEALLHHLIKTNYDTEAISGYFSCFILNEKETIILVDDSAPIYTDGRIYSSHDLWGKEGIKIDLKKVTWSKRRLLSIETIKVTKTNYGLDQAHLSLGWGGDYSPYSSYTIDNVEDFLYCITLAEENELLQCRTSRELRQKIRELSRYMQIPLNKKEVKEAARLLLNSVHEAC